MEPTSQDPRKMPETPDQASDQASEQLPEPALAPTPPVAIGTGKKSKKPLLITLVTLVVLVAVGCAGWFWWSGQQLANDANNASDQPANNITQQKAPEPNTIAYSYHASTAQTPYDLFWRSADGGERQPTQSKAFVSSTEVLGNQVLVSTYADSDDISNGAPSILHSSDGGKTYKTIFTGKAPTSGTDFGDQITSIQFASDGKSVLFGLLPGPGGKNTVKRVFFDKPNEAVDVMASENSGVFLVAFNAKNQRVIFFEGCYNCDGNASPTIVSYDLATKQKAILIDGKDKHLGVMANESATKLLITTPTIDKSKPTNDAFFGYHIGAPYKFTLFDLETGKTQDPGTTVGTMTENKFVRGGFMADDTTPYYYSGNQLFMLSTGTPNLLYEAGQAIHEVFYVSPTTVFASTGDSENYTLNRFGIKTQETKQLLTGDDSTTRIFGITQH